MPVTLLRSLLISPAAELPPLARMAAAKIPSKTLITIAEPLLRACQQSIPILKEFQVGDPAYDEIDNKLINSINTALREAKIAPHPRTVAEQKATS